MYTQALNKFFKEFLCKLERRRQDYVQIICFESDFGENFCVISLKRR